VLTSARRHSDALADWIASDVIFVNSRVDRLVSEPLEPAGAVAEPYALWAIERSDGLKAPCTHPSVQIVDDLGPIERRKLYILNLGHTYLVGKWLQSDRQAQYVRDLMEDPVARADLEQLYREEVLPVFQAVGDVEAEAYVATTLDRFANPYLAHKLADIAQNHSQKLERRIVAFMDWAKSKGVSIAQPRLEQVLKSSA
jgi:tagaturonate reductase